jgi:hypothetical protein
MFTTYQECEQIAYDVQYWTGICDTMNRLGMLPTGSDDSADICTSSILQPDYRDQAGQCLYDSATFLLVYRDHVWRVAWFDGEGVEVA